MGGAAVVVVVAAVAGFGLLGGSGKGETVQKEALVADARVGEPVSVVETVSGGTGSGEFVASKQGKKYFPADCGSAKTIKEENKVFFGSEAEAVAAGYERSLTCK